MTIVSIVILELTWVIELGIYAFIREVSNNACVTDTKEFELTLIDTHNQIFFVKEKECFWCLK